MIFLFAIFTIILFIVNKFINFKNSYLKAISKYLFIAFLFSIVLELTLFNFRHYESLLFKNNYKELTDFTYSGITCIDDLCQVDEIIDEETDTKQIDAYIEITDIDEKINNIYIDFNGKKKLTFSYDLLFTDEANKLYLDAGERTYVNNVENSKYLKVHSSGNSSSIKIVFNKSVKNFSLNTISINKEVPLFISNYRLFITLFVVLFILIINPKSEFYNIKFDNKKAKLVTIIFIICLTVLSYRLTLYNSKTKASTPTSQYVQYHNLAHALSLGHFYLDLDVDDRLLNLENPYDTNYRDSVLERYEEYYWDYAYYNGKYYSYFGVVPCILLYLPVYFLTGYDLPNNIAITISTFIFICSLFYLIYQIIKKYFKKTPYLWYMLLSTFFIFSSGIAAFVGYPTFYNIPIILGVAFSSLSLALYIKSTTYPKLNKKYLFLGSVCLALVAGCRPQLLLTFGFSVIIFLPYLKTKELFSKNSIKETLLFISPFIVVAAFLMYYNYARFSNPFDFGANYNLTTNDMTKRGFVFDRTLLGIFHFLFAPTGISTVFPFIQTYEINTTYLGNTISEAMHGGFLFTNLICLLGIFSYKFKKFIASDLFKISIASIIFALIIIIADTQMAGILSRYIVDFGWLIALSTIIVILSLLNKKVLNMDLKKIIIILISISIIYNMFTFFINKDLINIDKFRYMFMFWT